MPATLPPPIPPPVLEPRSAPGLPDATELGPTFPPAFPTGTTYGPPPLAEDHLTAPAAPRRPPPRTGVDATPASHATRRFAEAELAPGAGARRGIVAVLVVATLVAIAAGAVIALATARSPGRPAAPALSGPVATTTPPPTTLATSAPGTTAQGTTAQGGAGAPPRNVKLADHGTSITVTWTDPSNGSVSFVIRGTEAGGRTLPVQSTPKGQTSATFTNLNKSRQYCFKVGAIYAYNNLVSADDVCTKR